MPLPGRTQNGLYRSGNFKKRDVDGREARKAAFTSRQKHHARLITGTQRARQRYRPGDGVGKPAHDMRTLSTIDNFRAAFGSIASRSVHHNVAKLDAARAIVKSEDWPPNVVSIAEARVTLSAPIDGANWGEPGLLSTEREGRPHVS
jgi:hypothetical protein